MTLSNYTIKHTYGIDILITRKINIKNTRNWCFVRIIRSSIDNQQFNRVSWRGFPGVNIRVNQQKLDWKKGSIFPPLLKSFSLITLVASYRARNKMLNIYIYVCSLRNINIAVFVDTHFFKKRFLDLHLWAKSC